jgi:hypothetical protein
MIRTWLGPPGFVYQSLLTTCVRFFRIVLQLLNQFSELGGRLGYRRVRRETRALRADLLVGVRFKGSLRQSRLLRSGVLTRSQTGHPSERPRHAIRATEPAGARCEVVCEQLAHAQISHPSPIYTPIVQASQPNGAVIIVSVSLMSSVSAGTSAGIVNRDVATKPDPRKTA